MASILATLPRTLEHLLGLEAEKGDLLWWQMGVRAAAVFLACVWMVRLGHKRALGRSTAMDALLIIIFGSLMSRAITGEAPFFATIGSGAVLVVLHRVLAMLAWRYRWFGELVKGRPAQLVKGGVLCAEAMKAAHITEHDLQEALHVQGYHGKLEEIEDAFLERDGTISIVPLGSERRWVMGDG